MECKILKKLGKSKVPILIILVGESGVGKTTFVNKMKSKNNWFESSKAIICELRSKNIEINHNTIHSLAVKKYEENSYWQIPQILKELFSKDFLVLDGPRRFREVEALLKKANIRKIIVRIKVLNDQKRTERLIKRDGIENNDFEKIVNDETRETEIEKIISLADLEIINNKRIEDFEEIALNFRKIINKCLK